MKSTEHNSINILVRETMSEKALIKTLLRWRVVMLPIAMTLTLLSSGCASSKILDTKTGKRLDRGEKWSGGPVNVEVLSWDALVRPHPSYMPYIVGIETNSLSKFEYKGHERNFYDPPEVGEIIRVPTDVVIRGWGPDCSYTAGDKGYMDLEIVSVPKCDVYDIRENLDKTLSDFGLISKKQSTTKIDYYIRGRCGTFGMRDNAKWAAWVVVMAIPSMVLPVPLCGGPESVSVKVTLYDSDLKLISSRMILQAEQTNVSYSLWSLGALQRAARDSFSDAAALLAMEMIQEHEQEK